MSVAHQLAPREENERKKVVIPKGEKASETQMEFIESLRPGLQKVFRCIVETANLNEVQNGAVKCRDVAKALRQKNIPWDEINRLKEGTSRFDGVIRVVQVGSEWFIGIDNLPSWKNALGSAETGDAVAETIKQMRRSFGGFGVIDGGKK